MMPRSNSTSRNNNNGYKGNSHYSRKPKFNSDEQIKTTTHHKVHKTPVVKTLEPSEKYAKTMELLKAKGFFVDAEYGNRIRFDQIEEFRVDGRDVPVLIANIQYKNKRQDIVRRKKVYRIVRYNDKEIIGMVSKNENYDVLNFVKVDTTVTPVPEKVASVRPHRSYR